VTKWLSAEWCEQTQELAAGLQGSEELSARIQVVVAGGPDGDVSYVRELQAGRMVGCAPGRIRDPEVVLSSGWQDARAMAAGELDPGVAFMQGRLKVTGSMAVVLMLLALTATPDGRELRRRIAEVSED
jgi:putative sterol carrier protein